MARWAGSKLIGLLLAAACSPAVAPAPVAPAPIAPAPLAPERPEATPVAEEGDARRSVHRRLASAEAAVAAYFELFPKAKEVPRNDDVMRARATLSAPCRKSIERIVDTMGPSPPLSVGTLQALDRDAPCWVVYVPANPFHGAQGYLDQATGDLLAVWDIPEG